MRETSNTSLSLYEKEFDKLKKQVEYKNSNNIKVFAAKSLINCGIALDYCLPFLVSAFIVGNILSKSFNNVPFVKDEVVKCARVETTDTSSGIHLEKISYDYNYDDVMFEYSTGWKKTEEGLYERVSTSYVTNGIDFSDVDQVLAMSKEEIDEKFFVNNIKTIKKNNLVEEDKIYDDECLTIIQSFDSETDFITRDETDVENVLSSALYIFAAVVLGGVFSGIKKCLIKVQISDRLRDFRNSYFYIDDEDLEKIEEIFKIRKENIDLLDDSSVVPSYQLRRK